MQERDVFERLTSDLSIQERKSLLEKIKVPETEAEDINTIDELTEDEELDTEVIYTRFSLFHKILVFFKVIFQKKKKDEVIEGELLKNIENRIERSNSDIVDVKNRLFLCKFHDELTQLIEYMAPIKRVMKFSQTDQRKDFFVYLGTFEMEEFTKLIILNTNPEKITEFDIKEDLAEVKKQVEKNLEDAFRFIYPDDKESMYQHAKTIHAYSEFLFFPVESMATYFRERPGDSQTCPMKEIRKYFLDFLDRLNSLRQYPSDILLEASYLFYREYLDSAVEEDSREEGLNFFLTQSRNLMNCISHFKKDLHLVDIARVMSHKVNYKPGIHHGGEDWFNLFKSAWESRVMVIFDEYRHKRSIKQHIADAVIFLGTPGIPHLDYYSKKYWVEYSAVRYDLSLGFLKHFLQKTMNVELMPVLKAILIDGEFYKDQNRDDLVNSINTISGCSDRVRVLDMDLSPHGKIGSEIDNFKKELGTENLRRKKISAKLEHSDSQAEYIVRDFIKAGSILREVLKGILFGQSGGQYDTLSNIGDLNRKQHKNMLPVIDSAFMRLDNAVRITTNLFDIERDK